ncbi:hypothetical protein C0Q70_11458 [Pomacea canaliculata]|uniref:Uncharacterized protein n=1 Tax=Pomacea canaliculata TaxID=400727 RepID=A0A2T7P642_POMCA|nr:hypothetical protein C0Q70_11458 [Pomacea canaliculata]
MPDLTSHHPGMSSNYQPSAVHPVVPLTAPIARVASSLAHPLSTAMPRVVSAAHAAAAMLAQRQQQAMMTHMMRQRYIRPVLLPGRLLPVQGSRPAVRGSVFLVAACALVTAFTWFAGVSSKT